MSTTAEDLLQGVAALAGFGLFFLAPGYLWGAVLDVAGFRRRSRTERLLWSVVLSFPLAIALCALAGRWLSPALVIAVLIGLAGVAIVLLARSGYRHATGERRAPPPQGDRSRRGLYGMAALMALFGAYCLLTTVPVQLGQRLYVSTVIADWSVRVAMVKAAMRTGGVPPINGLSTVGGSLFAAGHATSLRYYYFWYVVVADLARCLHLRAQPALAASCAWAGWGLIATAFLSLKYLLGVRERLQSKCFLLLVVGAVLGLDLLPTALLWLSPKLHPYPEMEYWHQDRTPSFLGAVLYAPHHIAAFTCLLAGTLVLLGSARGVRLPGEREITGVQLAGAAVFAGIAFAAAAGTSLFPTFCFVFVLSFWALDLLRRWEMGTVAALAGAGVIAVVLGHPYLRELSTGSSAATGFANLAWRNDSFLAMQQARHHLLTGHGARLAWLVRQPGVLIMDFFDLGFYLVVVVAMIRRELLGGGRLSPGHATLWALVLGAAVPTFFLSSTATSGPNDLGVDAGFLLRLGLQLWAVEWVWNAWRGWRARRLLASSAAILPGPAINPAPRTWLLGLAAALFCLGLGAQVYQVLSERFYYPLVGSGGVHKQMDAFTQDHLAARLYNIRAAWRAFDRAVPPSAPDTEAVQFNPVGAMQPAETLFNDHQVASWDTGCGTSYGGDYAACAPVYRSLLFLFGSTEAGVLAGRAENDRQDGRAARVATQADFDRVCHDLHLRAIMAESTDSIWRHGESWVWTAPVLASQSTVRVLGCPAGSWLGP